MEMLWLRFLEYLLVETPSLLSSWISRACPLFSAIFSVSLTDTALGLSQLFLFALKNSHSTALNASNMRISIVYSGLTVDMTECYIITEVKPESKFCQLLYRALADSYNCLYATNI